jgi:hypothetical protein
VLSLFSLLCLHQSSSNAFQWKMFPFLWLPETSMCLSHSKCQSTPAQLLLSQEDSSLPCFKVKVKVILWPTVSRPVRPGVKHPSGTREKFFNCIFFCLDSCGFVDVGSPLWQKDGPVICSAVTQIQFEVILWPTVVLASSSWCQAPFTHILHEQGDPAQSQSQNSKLR